MRNYTPTYPARYTPRAAGEPARAQIGLAPGVPYQFLPVCPASVLYGRKAKSVAALRADSRISGPCLSRTFDAEGMLVSTTSQRPRSPYVGHRLNAEQVHAIFCVIGHPPLIYSTAAMFCGVQPGDGISTSVASSPDAGILKGFRDPTCDRTFED